MSKRAISYNIKNIKEGKGPERRKSARPKKLFGDDMRCLANLALSHPKWSCKQLVAQLLIRRHITVRTSLKRSGIAKWTARKAPSLTKQQKENRVQWCLDNQNTDWTKVIFTDEAYFQAFSVLLNFCTKGIFNW